MISPQKDFIFKARSMLGVKWRHQGRKPWAVDCAGLVLLCLWYAGVDAKDVFGYGREPWKSNLEKHLENHFGKPIVLSEAKEGDIVLMKWRESPGPSHVAIICNSLNSNGLSLIHAYSGGCGAVCEQDLDNNYAEKIVGVYRPWHR